MGVCDEGHADSGLLRAQKQRPCIRGRCDSIAAAHAFFARGDELMELGGHANMHTSIAGTGLNPASAWNKYVDSP